MSVEPHRDEAAIGSLSSDEHPHSVEPATSSEAAEVQSRRLVERGDFEDTDDQPAEADEADGPEEVAEPVAPARPTPPPLPVPRSSRPRRFGALMLELLLITVTMFAGWFVWSLRTWARGQTPAKSLLSMRCVRVETARVASWRTMALRELVGKGLLGAVTGSLAVLVSAVLILRSPDRAPWDRLAGTTVVDDPDGLTL